MTGVEPWRDQAACRGTNPALFYDPHPAALDAAKAVCDRCPVRRACGNAAIVNGEEFGVWGGLAADERRTPSRREGSQPGVVQQISDDELYDLLAEADPDRPAFDHLLEHVWMPTATAYRTLERAVRLGVAERRSRGLFPVRR